MILTYIVSISVLGPGLHQGPGVGAGPALSRGALALG